jgi:hypothetical protein
VWRCQAAEGAVRRAVMRLSERLANDLPVLVHVTHWLATLQALSLHAAEARRRGWCLPRILPEEGSQRSEGSEGDGRRVLSAKGLVPYWLDSTSGAGGGGGFGVGGAVANDVALGGGEMVLLTAPNMSGKSTLMRSLLSAALLANCGLHAPCGALALPRFDGFFMRTAGHDVPAEGKVS